MQTFSKQTLPIIDVVVELAPTLTYFADSKEQQVELHDRLLGYINQLTTNLQLPLTTSLTIRKLATNLEHHMFRSYQLTIAGQTCRLPMPISSFQKPNTLTLATEIAEAICQNRERFLTPTLIETIYRDLIGNDQETDSLSSETLRQLLTELIRRGFGIHRGIEFVRSYQDRKFDNSEELIECPYPDCNKRVFPDQIMCNCYLKRLLPPPKEIKPVEPGSVAAKLFEQVIASLDNLSISLWTSTSFQEFATQQSVPTDVSSDSTQMAFEAPESGSDSQSSPLRNEKLRQIQEELFYELGILCPLVHIQQSQDFRDNEFQIQLNDLRFPAIFETEPESVIEILKDRIRTNAGAFLNIEIWQYYLKLLKPQFPVLVDAIGKHLDPILVIRTLRTLLDEEISIQDLLTILETLLAINGNATVNQSKYIVFFPNTANFLSAHLQAKPDSKIEGNSIVAYADAVRASLKRYISYKYTRGSATLRVYLLDPKVEEKIQLTDDRPLQPEEHNRLLKAIFETVQSGDTILTTVETRKRLRQLIDVEFPKLPVLSYQELAPDLNIQPIGNKLSL